MSSPLQCKRVVVGSDHAGYQLKSKIAEYLRKIDGLEIVDPGCHSTDRCDYPDNAKACCEEVLQQHASLGILVCGTGLGVSIAANKVAGIRCALCHDYFTAESCRKINDANVMAVGEKTTGEEVAKQMVDIFIRTAFMGSHQQARVEKISAMEAEMHAAKKSRVEHTAKM
eukprot:TRINITY_DN40836_c0_g1_i1.p1 TRINITY_DN40836_c0_g1~~TRINITY_DN40836_c0_g1_i1.p1  ORF type:complete len:192 (+),score=42.19 TRINITY_DN40836_c0_g1_i1:68-577(+)